MKGQHCLELEFESCRIFQVCVENPKIPLYLEGKDLSSSSNPDISEKAYWFVCQVLNLFEIIISYRRDEIIASDVFATWVSWFHELGTAPRFKEYWEGEELWAHYKKDLREIMCAAVKIVGDRPRAYDDELEDFHDQVARIMNDPAILKHFKDARRQS